jgi:HAD superfamily hydrolase (TIGR01509 family)
VTVRAVVFDVGETLVDESRTWGLQADELGVSKAVFFAALGAVIERRQHHRRVFNEITPGSEPAEAQLLHYREEDLYPDVRPCLEALRADGFVLAVAANQPASTEGFIASCDLPFDLISSSEGWGLEKPDPRFFERVVAELGLEPEEVAYVGDRVDYDIVPAAAAGLVAVFIRRGPWGFIHASWPEVDRAQIRIESLTELPGALASLPR